MTTKKNDLESYLKQLEDLDKRLNNDDPDANPAEFISEVNKVLNGLSSDLEFDIPKKILAATLTFVNTSKNPDPAFIHEGDSGFDIRADLEKGLIIPKHEIHLIPTGLYFEVANGLEIQIRSRSGLAGKNGVMVLNSPGTIDSQYRGEIKIILANFGSSDFVVNPGDRIAQAVVCPVYGEGNLNFVKVEKLSETKRNTDGFGSTGKT